MLGTGGVLGGEANDINNIQTIQLEYLRLVRVDDVGVEDSERLHPGVEQLGGTSFVVVGLVCYGQLRVEPTGEDELEHAQVLWLTVSILENHSSFGSIHLSSQPHCHLDHPAFPTGKLQSVSGEMFVKLCPGNVDTFLQGRVLAIH